MSDLHCASSFDVWCVSNVAARAPAPLQQLHHCVPGHAVCVHVQLSTCYKGWKLSGVGPVGVERCLSSC